MLLFIGFHIGVVLNLLSSYYACEILGQKMCFTLISKKVLNICNHKNKSNCQSVQQTSSWLLQTQRDLFHNGLKNAIGDRKYISLHYLIFSCQCMITCHFNLQLKTSNFDEKRSRHFHNRGRSTRSNIGGSTGSRRRFLLSFSQLSLSFSQPEVGRLLAQAGFAGPAPLPFSGSAYCAI